MVNPETKGFVILTAAGFLYSLYGVFSRAIGSSLANFFQYWTRGLIITLIILVILRFQKISLRPISKHLLPWAVITATTSGIIIPTFFIAVNNLAIGTTLFMFYATSTICSYALGKLLHGEIITKIKIVSLTLAIAGLSFIFTDTIDIGNIFYMSLAMISGALFGVNINSVKKLGNYFPSLQINIFNWTGAFFINILISIFLRETPDFNLLQPAWISNIGLSLCSLGASLSVIVGFKFIEVQKGSIILLSELLFGVMIGLLLYSEIPTLLTILGSILIFIALLLPNLKQFN